MPLASTRSVALTGVRGVVIEIEVDIAAGLPGLSFTGLPDVAVSESRDRVRSAVVNSGFGWPAQRITVALLPADVRKSGSGLDLALALAVLAAAGEVPRAAVAQTAWFGELGLDGRLRPVRGVLPAVLAARAAGVTRVVVPVSNAAEAGVVGGVAVAGAASLREIALALRGEGPALSAPSSRAVPSQAPLPDLVDVVGQPEARRALEIAAAGAHHLLMEGAPGAGKTMLASRLPGILPPLTEQEALEVTAIHSVAGALPADVGLLRHPPLQAPHHTASMAALVGGGSGVARPGAATLAHRGVLVLDEAAEFAPSVLDSLRQPLESGRIVLHRSLGQVEYPARFQLVLATNPCPCGAVRAVDCRCRPDTRRRYAQRLSGPLTDRIDLRIAMNPVSPASLLDEFEQRESSECVGRRVRGARAASSARWAPLGWSTNAEVPGSLLRERPWRPARRALASLDFALECGRLSARGFDRVLKLSWTLADLAGAATPTVDHVDEAVRLRTGLPGAGVDGRFDRSAGAAAIGGGELDG
ncbi:YifB family Mg chelatase-like AAA ATPase [Jatrophihabitans telluris]|uniref:YifB family Mg chelatase-like AAA ATPase n=1 Tax=Jatrophihabitans telluris TaxID=2038343 RepID=A0ABY4R5I4_9ACTN|nr:YifB family Mg chelatase-like AAA ATPase [Jatrophihabitans telluris]UQX90009.1 YifB family Mg chelatase-like AAA ATPase [Jatrophihabitans telluris]